MMAGGSKIIDVTEDDALLGAEDTQDSEYRDDTSSLISDTTSLSSSVFNYEYENGRR